MSYLHKIINFLPSGMQHEVKRIKHLFLFYFNKFYSGEIEYSLIQHLISEGDWIIDVGANIGHYTIKFSNLAGETGRVLAFEPIPDTFNHLSSICKYSRYPNISLFNVAVSDNIAIQSMEIPTYQDGVKNYYRAQITKSKADFNILSISFNGLDLPHRINFIKIDAEGHDYNVIRGLEKIIETDKPLIMLEECSKDVISTLGYYNYHYFSLANSHNTFFYQDSMKDKIEDFIKIAKNIT